MIKSAFCIIKRKGRILLYLRDNEAHIPAPNHWAFLGGRVENGETPLEAVKRELNEEINCKVHNIEFIDKIIRENDSEENDETFFIFKGAINENLDKIRLFEGQKLGYFTFEECLKLKMAPIFKNFLMNNKDRIF